MLGRRHHLVAVHHRQPIITFTTDNAPSKNQSKTQSIKTNFYSAIRRERIRGV